MKMKLELQNLNVQQIEMLVFDFDGVMTDNRVLVDECGKESVFVSRADGMGINMLKEAGFECMILSTEQNPVVGKRAEKLKINVIQGVGNKKEVLCQYVKSRGIDLKNILYVGNDVNDLEAMQTVGISVVPSDAYDIVKNEADVVLDTRGGYGVVRELAEYLAVNSVKRK